MGGIRDEAAAGLLRGLEAVREAVELLGDLGELVPSLHRRPVGVGSLPDGADGLQQLPDLPGQDPGEHRGEPHHDGGHDAADPQKVFLEARQQLRLLGIILIGVDRADDLVPVHDGGSSTGAEGAVFVAAGGNVVAQKSLDHLSIEDVLPLGGAGLPGVVENTAAAVRHQDPGEARLLRRQHGAAHILLRQALQGAQGGGDDGDAALHVGHLGVEDQVLGYQDRISIQQHQHRRDDEDVAEAEPRLQAAPAAPSLGLIP